MGPEGPVGCLQEGLQKVWNPVQSKRAGPLTVAQATVVRVAGLETHVRDSRLNLRCRLMHWWWWLLVAVGSLAATWGALIVLAQRLPPGNLRDAAVVIPACVTTARRLRRDPRVPRRVKLAVVFALVWTISPIDLIPEFLPVIGPLDDIVVIALALRYAAKRIPAEALTEAWPADQRLLARLLGRRRAPEPE